jgi:ubiquinone/menaquinone biosynthesis C-methylase UbiE
LKFTGERMIPEENKGSVIWAEHLVRYIFSSQFVRGKTVLDIACGSGFGSYHLTTKGAEKVIGVDISEEAIQYAKKKFRGENIQYLVGDCESIPLPKETVDVIVSFETIEHINNYEKFLKEIKRVATPDSLVILSTPNRSVHPKGNPFHTKEFNYSEIRGLLSKYFKNLKFLYQHNWFSSAMFDEKLMKSEKLTNSLNEAKLFKLISDQTRKSLYYVVLASDGRLPDSITFPVGLFSPFIDFNEMLTSLHQRTEVLEGEIKNKDEELENIYGSKSWKLVVRLRKLKKSTPLVKNL